MNKSLRRRVAAVATTATVGGLLLPFLAAGSALAAAPTSLTVSPTVAYSSTTNLVNGTNFAGGFVGGAPAGGNVFAAAITGPDSSLIGQPCTITGTTYACNFQNGATAGVDQMRFFYDASGVGNYNSSFPSAAASLSVAGPVSKVVLTPTSSSAAQYGYAKYAVSATDAAGRPVTGVTLDVTASEANTNGLDLDIQANKPSPYYTTGAINTPVVGATTGSATASTNPTNDGTLGTVAGQANFYVASKVKGTVDLSISTSPANVAISAIGTLTVNGGLTTDDVAAVTISPATQRAFNSDTASVVVNLRNAQGNPISQEVPVVAVTDGPDKNAPITLAGTGETDGDGNVTATFPTSANGIGDDTVFAFVNQTKNPPNSLGFDTGEPSAKATVTVGAFELASIADNGPFTVPLSVTTTVITYTVKAVAGASPAGYVVKFAVNPVGGKFTLSTPSAVTDANGKASVTLTNASPADGDAPQVTATSGSAALSVTTTTTVNYEASAISATGLKITPFANTTTVNGIASFSASATDQFGNPVSGLTYDWSLSGGGRNNPINNPAVGTGATFSYTDVGPANAEGSDVVTVQARNAAGAVVNTATADQYWVTTPAKATQANIDFALGGMYTENRTGVPFGQRGPIVGSGFTTKTTTGVTKDPTLANPVIPTPVRVMLTDAADHRLYGKSVSFTSTGVGEFTDAQGYPINSATALVADGTAVGQDFNYHGDFNGSVADYATIFVRSTQTGTQTITATVDGISTNATVTYTGEYVGVTPNRVVDTRTGQGSIYSNGGGYTKGPLAPGTYYNFSYANAGIPLNQAAYVFNVTGVHPTGVGNLRVAPGSAPLTVPDTSLINYQSGVDVANLLVVPNTAGVGVNTLDLYSAGSATDVTIDLVGYYSDPASISTTVPSRIADTRTSGGAVGAGATRAFQVAGQGGIPGASAKAVALNVTVVNPAGLGNLRIFADGDAVPTTSNINYIPGQDKSAFVIVNLPANGKIDVYSAGTAVDVVIDAYASYDKVNSNLVTQTPSRILDTRTAPSSAIPADHEADLQVAGVAGVPIDAQAVLVSVTGIHTAGSTGVGNLRVYPAGTAVPLISTLNYVSPTTDVANFAIVKLSADGKISIASFGSPIDVAVDVVGYIPAR